MRPVFFYLEMWYKIRYEKGTHPQLLIKRKQLYAAPAPKQVWCETPLTYISFTTTIMKQNIHPKYYDNAVIRCACGNTFKTGSTKEHIEVEICSACHPFYTGKEKLVDTIGRVEKFRKRVARREELKKKKSAKKK